MGSITDAVNSLDPQTILASIADIAKTSGHDAFRIKAQRREGSSPFPVTIATLDGARAEQLQHAQLWLPMLAGGGQYQLQVFHADALERPIGGFLTYGIEGQPRPVDQNVNTNPDWTGPRLVVSQRRLAAAHQEFSNMPSNDPPREQYARPNVPQPPVASTNAADMAFIASERARLAAEADRQRERERTSEIERQRFEKQATDERHQRALEAMQRTQELEMAKLRTEINRPAPAQAPGLEVVLVEMMKSSQQNALMIAKMQEEANTRMVTMMQESAREQREFLKTLSEKKEDPLVSRLIERSMNQGQESAAMMGSMSAVVAQVTNMMLATVGQIRELQAPEQEQEPLILKVADRVLQGVQAAAEMAKIRHVPAPVPQARVQPPKAVTTPRLGTPPTETPGAPAPVEPSTVAVATVTNFDQIVTRIKAMERPPDGLVNAFIGLAQAGDPSVLSALAKHGGNIVNTFAEALVIGGWLNAPEHVAYVKDLVEAFQASGLTESNQVAAQQADDQGDETDALEG